MHADRRAGDVRDIGEAAATALLRREPAGAPLARETYRLVDPEALTGPALAPLWDQVIERPIR